MVAAITDDQGNIKRLNNSTIRFEIEGAGELVADEEDFTNPRAVQWGTAPILVRALPESGEIRIKASLTLQGKHTPVSGELVLKTTEPMRPLIADKEELEALCQQNQTKKENRLQAGDAASEKMRRLQQEQNRERLKEVEQQQSDFE